MTKDAFNNHILFEIRVKKVVFDFVVYVDRLGENTENIERKCP